MLKCHKTPALAIILILSCLGCTPAHAYSLGAFPDSGVPGQLVLEMEVDSPTTNTIFISNAQALGSDDHWMGKSDGCYGTGTQYKSCLVVALKNGKKMRQFQQNVRACLPSQGPGTLANAVTAFVQQHFVSRAIPQIGSHTWGTDTSLIFGAFALCDHGFHIVYQAEGSPSAPLICNVDAPAVVELGTLSTSSTRAVRAGIKCSGGGESDVRVSVQGPTTIRPVRGLELWASAPERALHITGDGAPTYVDLTVGATIDSPKPGFYSGSFVYKIEYL